MLIHNLRNHCRIQHFTNFCDRFFDKTFIKKNMNDGLTLEKNVHTELFTQRKPCQKKHWWGFPCITVLANVKNVFFFFIIHKLLTTHFERKVADCFWEFWPIRPATRSQTKKLLSLNDHNFSPYILLIHFNPFQV